MASEEIPASLGEVQLYAVNWTVSHWVRGTEEHLDLDAPYQRGSVWDVDRQRNLIRSLMMGLPIGTIVYSDVPFGHDPTNPESCGRVVDGKQRIEAVRAFAAGEFTIPGSWLPEGKVPAELRARDVTCDEIPPAVRRARFDSRSVPGLEFHPAQRHVENPEYDTNEVDYRGDPVQPRYVVEHLTHDEAIAAEAEVFLLINFGGVDQSAETMTNAARIAGGE